MEPAECARFETLVLRHLDAAHNLARHLTGNSTDADDVVQESFLRAIRHFRGFVGDDARAWLLVIVRNVSYDFLKSSARTRFISIDDTPEIASTLSAEDSQAHFEKQLDWARIEHAMQSLPVEFREVIVLREVEELSYAEIAAITGLAAGTVMSRLSRARRRLRTLLASLNSESA